MGDPTEEQLAGCLKLGHAADYVGLAGSATDQLTARGSLFDLLGVADDSLPAILGVIDEQTIHNIVDGWRVAKARTPTGEFSEFRNATIGEKGAAKFLARICRLKLGVGRLVPAQVAPSAPSLPSSAARKFKLCQVLSQIDDTEIELLSEKELLAAYGRYEVLFGKGQRPPTDRDPTVEQLSAVQALLKSCQTPYADFAVFGPHGTRIFKKLKFQGLTLNKAGELVQSELYGPPTLAVWKACFETYTNLMVMLDAADLGPLLQHKSKVERLHDRFGDKTWALLYQADVRCRLEHLPRARMELKQRHLEAVALGNTTAYDDLRPWNEAYRAVADADKFWSEEFIEPALLVIADRSAMHSLVADDARTAAAATDHPSGLLPPVPPPNAKAAVRPRNPNRTGRHHEIVDGKYQLNRTGFRLCPGFQDETCTHTVRGNWCGRDSTLTHQCSRCLGNHPLTKCPHSEPPVVALGRKGKDKGKGKGKGAKNRPTPY